jgi:putative Mg2+ transporter-C (MgtC) family protein
MLETIFGAEELRFLLNLGVALICGGLIGFERERKGKPAGISTQTLVISGAMMFAFLSSALGNGDPGRIAAQIVSGIGFLGAGIILKSESKNKVTNVTTAASIWYAAGIGMAIGFELYVIAILAALYAVIIARIPHSKNYIDD